MFSVRMGLQAINKTKRLAKVISRPHGKVIVSVTDPSSWYVHPVCPCVYHLVSLHITALSTFLLTVLPHGASFFDTTLYLFSPLSFFLDGVGKIERERKTSPETTLCIN